MFTYDLANALPDTHSVPHWALIEANGIIGNDRKL
jgi:hypothetical protein